MAKVGIVMGSDSDLEIMAKAADVLEEFGVEYEMTIISAHREPEVFFEYAKGAEERGFKVIIAGAGQSVLHRPDAARNPGGDRSDQRRQKRRASGREDACHERS